MQSQVSHTFEPSEFQDFLRVAIRAELQSVISQIQNNQQPEKEYLTRAEVCQKLNISLGTLHTKTKTGKIKSHRIGRRILYKYQDVNDSVNVRNFRAVEGGKG
jgi:excisionase family DNA binding protein